MTLELGLTLEKTWTTSGQTPRFHLWFVLAENEIATQSRREFWAFAKGLDITLGFKPLRLGWYSRWLYHGEDERHPKKPKASRKPDVS